MNGAVKTILIVLGILLLIPIIGVVFRTVFGILMGIVGLILGILAIPVSLVGGLIGILIGLLFLGVPILILVGIVGLGFWAVSQASGRKSEKRRTRASSDMETMRDIHEGLDRMEERLNSLETLLSDR